MVTRGWGRKTECRVAALVMAATTGKTRGEAMGACAVPEKTCLHATSECSDIPGYRYSDAARGGCIGWRGMQVLQAHSSQSVFSTSDF